MVATHSAFDFDKLTFAAKLETNKRGGKYAQVGYDGSQVFFQLGDSPREALRCPFGLDTPCAEEKDKRVLKLELTPATRAFLNTFDKAVVTAAERNSMEWFKKSTPSSNHVSSIKTQNGDRPDIVKLKVQMDGERATKVSVSSLFLKCRSEGFPNGTFHPCTLWDRAQAKLEKSSTRCRRRH